MPRKEQTFISKIINIIFEQLTFGCLNLKLARFVLLYK